MKIVGGIRVSACDKIFPLQEGSNQKTRALKILIPILALVLIFQLISRAFPALVPYEVHRAAGLLLGAIVILHIILNWPWIRANYLKR